MRGKGQGLIDLGKWPAEPEAPNPVDVQVLGKAFRKLCGGWMPPRRPFRYAQWIVESSKEFEIDPYLLASLIHRQSRCLPKERSDYGMGLSMINYRMHAPYIKNRTYHYWILEQGVWQKRELAMPRYAFVPGNLLRSRSNIYFAAALLRVNKEQFPYIKGTFGSVSHRHFVSNFIWGDRVKGAGAEDRVFRSRRRLLEYYTGVAPKALANFNGLALRCPLDGAPRKVFSGMGRDRSDGKRRHKGIDFASTRGEPVYAVADGRVILAGLDRPRGASLSIDPKKTKKIKRSEMGPGGLYVMIRHEKGLISAYMHLASYIVKTGQQVKQGDRLGVVGRTGIKESGPHLHFELRYEGRHIDPIPHLSPYVFPPQATYQGQRIDAELKRVQRRRRIARWKAYKAARAARKAKGEKCKVGTMTSLSNEVSAGQ
jgi:hypothetical protein